MTARLAVSIAGAVALAFAQPEVLTMDDAVRRAMETHPDLAASRASRAVARFHVQAARVLPAPEFRVSANNLAFDPDTAELRHSMSWRWSPPRPRAISLREGLGQSRLAAVDAGIQLAEARVAAAVRHAYRRAALAAERATLARQAAGVRDQMVDVTRRQVASGLKEAVESDIALLAHADAQAESRRAAALAESELRRLTRLIDPAGAVSFILHPLPAAFDPPDSQALVERALRARPELAQAAATCRESESAIAIAGNERYPWISFVQVTRRLGADTASRGPWGIQFGVDLPLFRTQARAEGKIAAATLDRCRLEELALRTRVRQEVQEAAEQIAVSSAELAKLEELVEGPAARALANIRAALAAGRADRLDALNAEARHLSLRDRWLDRRLAAAELEAKLELASGL